MTSLIEQILAGDNAAVETFYKTYSPIVLSYLKQKLPKDDAQEIANDVFLDAIDSLHMLHNSSHIKAWLYKIAHNKMVNYYRKKKIKTFFFSQFEYLKLIAPELTQPEFELEKKEALLKMQLTIKTLSQKYQEILRMHYVNEMPLKMIAIELNVSFKTAESRLYRARQRFIKDYARA